MVVIGLLAAGATLAIKMYRWVNQVPGGDEMLASVKTQAAVIATFAGFVFSLLEALTKMKIMIGSSTSSTATTTGYSFGGPGGVRTSPVYSQMVPS